MSRVGAILDEAEVKARWSSFSIYKKISSVIGIVLCAYVALYVSGILNLLGIYVGVGSHRALALALLLALTFLNRPAREKDRDRLRWYDLLFILMGLLPCGYWVLFQDAIWEHRYSGFATTTEVVLCFFLMLALLEAGRRVIDWILPAIALAFIIHPLVSGYMPSILYAKGLSIQRIVSVFYLSESGIFGQTVGVATTVVITFMIFSQFLLASGASHFFLKLAMAVVGTVRGGPAKVAIIASSLFGMISGSPTGNVAAVGTVTIPLMKKTGYSPVFAAAVEAVASTGGQIMPPVMGTVAFIMADITKAGYGGVCIAAAVPAILYYLGIFLQVDFRAAKIGLSGVPRSELPPLLSTLKEGWQYLVPLIVLIVLVGSYRYDAEKSALFSAAILYVLALFRKESRLGLTRVLATLDESAQASLWAAIPCAVSGIIVASLAVTGIGVVFSLQVVNLAGNSVTVLLILAAIANFILGTGLGVIAVYVILGVLVAPALVDMGVNVLAAHLFIVYWGVMSFITPPVALSAFVAAGIAEADSWKAGWQACFLGIVAYLVPFMFVMNPNLILIGSAGDIALTILLAVFGVFLLAAAIEGYFIKEMTWFPRTLFMIGGFSFFMLNWRTQVAYTALALLIVLPGLLWHIWGVVIPSRRAERGLQATLDQGVSGKEE